MRAVKVLAKLRVCVNGSLSYLESIYISRELTNKLEAMSVYTCIRGDISEAATTFMDFANI